MVDLFKPSIICIFWYNGKICFRMTETNQLKRKRKSHNRLNKLNKHSPAYAPYVAMVYHKRIGNIQHYMLIYLSNWCKIRTKWNIRIIILFNIHIEYYIWWKTIVRSWDMICSISSNNNIIGWEERNMK